MSGYNKTCIYCNKDIRLSNDSGKWLPYNLDGTAHECKDKLPQQQPRQPNKVLSLEDLDARLKSVEHIVLRESK